MIVRNECNKTMKQNYKILLKNALPKFYGEITELIRDIGKVDLLEQLPYMQITSRCPCKEENCASFNVKTSRSLNIVEKNIIGSKYDESIDLDAKKGMIIMDLDNFGRITGFEVLGRPDVSESLNKNGFKMKTIWQMKKSIIWLLILAGIFGFATVTPPLLTPHNPTNRFWVFYDIRLVVSVISILCVACGIVMIIMDTFKKRISAKLNILKDIKVYAVKHVRICIWALVVLLFSAWFYFAKQHKIPDRALTRNAMEGIKRDVYYFSQKYSRLPDTIEELISFKKCKTIDAWGNPISYHKESGGVIVLQSYGKDGVCGGSEDDKDMIGKFEVRPNMGNSIYDWIQDPYD